MVKGIGLRGIENAVIATIAKQTDQAKDDVIKMYIRTGRNFNHTISLCKMAQDRGLVLLEMEFQTMRENYECQK